MNRDSRSLQTSIYKCLEPSHNYIKVWTHNDGLVERERYVHFEQISIVIVTHLPCHIPVIYTTNGLPTRCTSEKSECIYKAHTM